ncbi:MAG TPA: hypothetical protein PK231_03250 [Acidocella sp.]|nr:hypothetical protein [Acidocella sp.]
MDGVHLADKLAFGAGRAARRIGFLHDAYRPDGPEPPIDLAKRIMRLSVAFVLPGGSISAPSGMDVAYRQAWADWSYLQVGDYLVGPEGCALVASIEPPKPMLVVMTNANVTLSRPSSPVLAGVNSYGAPLPSTWINLVSGYPASLMVGGLGDRTRAGLPDDTRLPGFIAILPAVVGVQPSVGDFVNDDRDERFVVIAVETIGGLWRLSLIQAVS